MTIKELEDKHKKIAFTSGYYPHTKLSIQFAIEFLEDFDEHTQINGKIEELKQYLDEKT